MPIEHPAPTESTVKYLYAHAFRCAYEGCGQPLYREDEQTGIKTLNSRVCHINARREGGPRWDPTQSTEDNRSEKNLVLMCVEHADTIDQPATLSAYPGERLREWKAKQLDEYEKLKRGWTINGDMARRPFERHFRTRKSSLTTPRSIWVAREATPLAQVVAEEEPLAGVPAADEGGTEEDTVSRTENTPFPGSRMHQDRA